MKSSSLRIVALTICCAAIAFVSGQVRAGEKLAGRAARSVHLQFDGPAGVAFYNEVTIDQSAPGTYFCVCGFNRGYFGLQEQGRGKKVAIFSVWDPGNQNDPNQVDENQRVRLVKQGEGVRIGRFGNEGTGGQSFLDVDWKIGETYKFIVAAKADGDDRMAFSGYLMLPGTDVWQHMVTFSTPAKSHDLSGYYSFVEDFRRDGESLTRTRSARFGNGAILNISGAWEPIGSARFTADANPATNIDATIRDGLFELRTGGDVKNEGTPLRERLRLPMPPGPPQSVPDGLEDTAKGLKR